MKKLLLFSATLFLIVAMMGCPSKVNRGPSFNRIVMVDGEEELMRLQSLTSDMYQRERSAFNNDPENEGETFDYKEVYGDQYIIYEHTQGEVFHPDDMLDDLINEQDVIAVDYVQDYVEIGADREYRDISDQIIVTSFYDIWSEDDFTEPLTPEEEDLLGQIKTDENGDYIYDQDKMLLPQIFSAGEVMEFTMFVEDEDGAESSISGLIVIVK
ncbi:MAG: VCBS domain-containing protein [Candidatus Izemoplasmatales bacterium]